MFLAFLEITESRIIAALGGIILMMSHSLWWHSTMLEVYTLNTAIIAAILLFVIRYNKVRRFRDLCITAFFIGLGCSNHLLMVLFVFGFFALVTASFFSGNGLKLWHFPVLVGFFLLGTGLYLFVFINDYLAAVRMLPAQSPGTLSLQPYANALKKTLDHATGEGFRNYMFSTSISPAERRFWRLNYLLIIAYNYPSSAVLLILFGLYCFVRRRSLRLTLLFYGVGIIAQVIWSSNFFIWDMYAFSLPVYLLLSVPVVFGLHSLSRKGRIGRLVLLFMLPTFIAPPFLYHAVSDAGCREGVVKSYFRNYPEWEQAEKTWDAVEYLTNPNKRSYAEVPAYVEKVFEVLPEKAHLWNSVGRADYPLRLYYRDIYRMRTDIKHHSLFNPFMSHEAAEGEAVTMKNALERGQPVYIASLAFPERLVLDQLCVLLNPGKDLDRVSRLPTERFQEQFPQIEFEEIVLFEGESISIYRLFRKEV
jgi:hypothetical protein